MKHSSHLALRFLSQPALFSNAGEVVWIEDCGPALVDELDIVTTVELLFKNTL